MKDSLKNSGNSQQAEHTQKNYTQATLSSYDNGTNDSYADTTDCGGNNPYALLGVLATEAGGAAIGADIGAHIAYAWETTALEGALIGGVIGYCIPALSIGLYLTLTRL